MLALAIALRLLVPQGWMPAPAGGLMICSGQMASSDHRTHDVPAKPTEDRSCAFAALGLAAAPPAASADPVAPPAIAAEEPTLTEVVAIGRGLAAPPPPATGPPAFA